MRPDASNYFKDFINRTYFGELDESNEPHGRGIFIYNDGGIRIGYWWNDSWGTGGHIYTDKNGYFEVSEVYEKEEGKRKKGWRGTLYSTDGTEEKYDD